MLKIWKKKIHKFTLHTELPPLLRVIFHLRLRSHQNDANSVRLQWNLGITTLSFMCTYVFFSNRICVVAGNRRHLIVLLGLSKIRMAYSWKLCVHVWVCLYVMNSESKYMCVSMLYQKFTMWWKVDGTTTNQELEVQAYKNQRKTRPCIGIHCVHCVHLGALSFECIKEQDNIMRAMKRQSLSVCTCVLNDVLTRCNNINNNHTMMEKFMISVDILFFHITSVYVYML